MKINIKKYVQVIPPTSIGYSVSSFRGMIQFSIRFSFNLTKLAVTAEQ